MKHVRWNSGFYIPFLIAMIGGLIVLFMVDKGEDVMLLNRLHAPFPDQLFRYGTEIGNGLLYLVVIAGLLMKNTRSALIALTCFAATGITVQILKRLVFGDCDRPSLLLAAEPLHFVEGVTVLKHFSFPSGHTAGAFSLFCLLSQLVPKRWAGLLFFSMAFMGGISRIYLVQHFFMDVYFGALLGVILTSLIWYLYSQHKVLMQLENKSLFSWLNV